jgi:hypothetical protein
VESNNLLAGGEFDRNNPQIDCDSLKIKKRHTRAAAAGMIASEFKDLTITHEEHHQNLCRLGHVVLAGIDSSS